MKRAILAILLCATTVAAQNPTPTWQECYDNPFLTPQYPGWMPDDQTEVGTDEYDNCGDDDCYRELLHRLINDVVHQRAVIAQLQREMQVLRESKLDAPPPCHPPDCYLVTPNGGLILVTAPDVVIGKGKP